MKVSSMSIPYNFRTLSDFALVCISPCCTGICAKMLLQSVSAKDYILEQRVRYLYLQAGNLQFFCHCYAVAVIEC